MKLPLLFLAATAAFAQLNGVIDIHVHSGPDSVARSIDALDLAKLAKSRGMRGLVLKNHYEPTASLAYVIRQVVPGILLRYLKPTGRRISEHSTRNMAK